MISTWIQSLSLSIKPEHAAPREPKSAERIEGAIIAGGPIVNDLYELARVYVGLNEDEGWKLRLFLLDV